MGKYKQTFSFEQFKEITPNEVFGKLDEIDKENGIMRIQYENLTKYLEEYSCKDFNDLSDTLYNSYGIFCTIIN